LVRPILIKFLYLVAYIFPDNYIFGLQSGIFYFMKKKIALIAGGYSDEYIISLRSVQTIEKNLDGEIYDLYKIIINREDWYHETADGSQIQVDKNDFSLSLNGSKIHLDAAFIAIHGTPGEDGKLQGYLEMIGIPFTTCNSIVSALTFNKNFCNKVVQGYGDVNISKSVVLYKHTPFSLGSVLEHIKLPVFVKPNESGSSLGISKVTAAEQLLPAIDKAFKEDNQVLIEEFIEGRELTIGVYKIKGEIHCLPPTEIISKNEFFDYEAKYTTGVTDEVTPAHISEDILEQLNRKAKLVFQNLDCRGMVRIDFILEKSSNLLYFLEVNTMPGQSENSLIPQQVKAAGMDLKTFYGSMLAEIL